MYAQSLITNETFATSAPKCYPIHELLVLQLKSGNITQLDNLASYIEAEISGMM